VEPAYQLAQSATDEKLLKPLRVYQDNLVYERVCCFVLIIHKQWPCAMENYC